MAPDEFQFGRVEQVLDHMVAQALDPGEDRGQPILLDEVLLLLNRFSF